ncbi:MAG: phosphoribosylformylglycinamidine synthase subunit PurQ, partial [Candidatus Methanofastidiosia archaeon]
MVNVCVLRIEGTNCEMEVARAFRDLGCKVELVHLNELKDLFKYQCLMIPGGFSAGDYVRAGAIFASRIKSKFKNELKKFVEEGFVLGGICNGFQVLVELSLLPDFDEVLEQPEAALTTNDSMKFECRPNLLKLESKNCAFTKYCNNEIYYMPSAHIEGKFVTSKKNLEKLIENKQIIFRYVDTRGNYASYPWNPNGSIENIAAICNPLGNVFGIMPHPERSFSPYLHQEWTRG